MRGVRAIVRRACNRTMTRERPPRPLSRHALLDRGGGVGMADDGDCIFSLTRGTGACSRSAAVAYSSSPRAEGQPLSERILRLHSSHHSMAPAAAPAWSSARPRQAPVVEISRHDTMPDPAPRDIPQPEWLAIGTGARGARRNTADPLPSHHPGRRPCLAAGWCPLERRYHGSPPLLYERRCRRGFRDAHRGCLGCNQP